mmetsp:Transcript_38548/g.101705  ORF Transcript_38548/g.101705 Transcript_38548/m.101705 type:complete len:463 (-) Transcript_38548:292-1680(-)
MPSGSKLLVGGFGLTGVPENLIAAIQQKGIEDLTVVSSNVGTSERGLGLLFQGKQISKMIGSYVGENSLFEKQYLNGEIDVELVPMGTLAERMRAAGAGIPAFYTATGVGTLVHLGNMPERFAADGSGKVVRGSPPRPSKVFGGKEYIMEEALDGDYALVRAWKGDTEGNLVYRMTSRNHNPAIATAGKVTIAEVEELVPSGALDPNEVHTPGIFVDRIVEGPSEKFIERLTLAGEKTAGDAMTPERERIVRRAALELRDGDYVNLGIGMPTLVSNFVPEDVRITLQSENGMLGVGPFPPRGEQDADLVNAGKQTISALPGASFFSADASFGMIRGGHCDVTVLGSMQVAANGDMANYLIPGKLVKGMGGAMDLVSSPARVIVTMEHCDRKGNSKVLPACTLPLTGERVVSLLITELGVFEIARDGSGMTLVEIAPGVELDGVRAATAAQFKVAGDLTVMQG